MTHDIVVRVIAWSTWLDERCPDTDVGNDLREAADEIERLRSRVEEFEKIIEKYDRDRIEYCDAWMKWIKDHDALDVMEWMMAYANAIPAPNPDGKSPVEIYAAIDARSREASIEIKRLRTRVSELEDVVAGRRPVL